MGEQQYVMFLFLLCDYHQALRREQRYAESDEVRRLLRSFGFAPESCADGWTEIDWWNQHAMAKWRAMSLPLHVPVGWPKVSCS